MDFLTPSLGSFIFLVISSACPCFLPISSNFVPHSFTFGFLPSCSIYSFDLKYRWYIDGSVVYTVSKNGRCHYICQLYKPSSNIITITVSFRELLTDTLLAWLMAVPLVMWLRLGVETLHGIFPNGELDPFGYLSLCWATRGSKPPWCMLMQKITYFQFVTYILYMVMLITGNQVFFFFFLLCFSTADNSRNETGNKLVCWTGWCCLSSALFLIICSLNPSLKKWCLACELLLQSTSHKSTFSGIICRQWHKSRINANNEMLAS